MSGAPLNILHCHSTFALGGKEARAVRLSAHTFHQRSLTAVTVAAHEVGHALQHAEGYAPLALRERLVRFAIKGQRLGAMMMVAVPVTVLLVPAPLRV